MKHFLLIGLAVFGMAATGCASKKPYTSYKSKEISVVLDPKSGGMTRLDYGITGNARKRVMDAPKHGETVTVHVQPGTYTGDPKKRTQWNQYFQYGYPDGSGPNAYFYHKLSAIDVTDAVFKAGGRACPPSGLQQAEDVRRAISVGNLTVDGRAGCPDGRPDGTIQVRSWVEVHK